MSSQRRINASRRNGARSRGPKTEAGKQTSSRNSLRHGLLAKTVLLDEEDEPAFIQLLVTLEEEHQPTTQTERDLVETMGIARWRILRLWAMERANLQEEISKDDTPDRDASTRAALAFRKLSDESRSADLLGRYETRYDRQYYRAFNLLLKMRNAAPNPPTRICQTNLVPKMNTRQPETGRRVIQRVHVRRKPQSRTTRCYPRITLNPSSNRRQRSIAILNRDLHPSMKLSDKYTLERGRVYLTGIQALVRLPIDQMRRDRRAGLNTGAFISGYEGSPLGGYDLASGARRASCSTNTTSTSSPA